MENNVITLLESNIKVNDEAREELDKLTTDIIRNSGLYELQNVEHNLETILEKVREKLLEKEIDEDEFLREGGYGIPNKVY